MFTLDRRSAIFRAEFKAPLFQAFNQAWQLQESLFQVLSTHRIRASDVRLERRDGEASCTANVISLGAVVNVRLTHIEVFFMSLEDTDPVRLQMLASLVECLRGFASGYRLFSLAYDHHGALDGGASASAFIGRYVQPPSSEALGAHCGSSAVFYYGPGGSRAATSVHLEASSIVQGGLFVKTNCVWNAEEAALDEVMRDAAAAARDSLAMLGLSGA
ncbi:MAG: hypothetical protein EB084_11645 [Proteobacteria bacterium]|nr:hypothetical protein [Pseudomonadota bacterium]